MQCVVQKALAAATPDLRTAVLYALLAVGEQQVLSVMGLALLGKEKKTEVKEPAASYEVKREFDVMT